MSLTKQCHDKSIEQNLQSFQQGGSSKEKSGLILYLDNQMSMGVHDQESLELSIKPDIEPVHYLVKTWILASGSFQQEDLDGRETVTNAILGQHFAQSLSHIKECRDC